MSVAAEELRDQLSQTSNNAEREEGGNKAESKGINHFATFPWLYGILRKCREAIGTKHMYVLDGLLYALVKELSISIKDCYSRPNRAGKLRDIVCQMLVYFNMIYRDLKQEYMDNNNTYLQLMTELLAIYLDLEIKASKRGVHSLKKIGQFMTTALYTHLGQSEDHIIEAILKAKLITKSAGELCAPVLFKVLNDGRCFIGDENAYVRFLLAFKLLHKITRRTDRYDITKMAMRKLDPAPELVGIVRRMNNIFPSQKIMDEPITMFLMNAKFDFIKAKLEFLRTGSISKGSPSDIHPEKLFVYDNRSNSITNLLKQCRKDEQKSNSSICDTWSNDRNKRDCSTDFDLEPCIYRISLRSEDNIAKENGRSEDDSNEIEFLGTQNKRDKPVVLITLDSDDEAHDKGGKEDRTTEESVSCPVPSERKKDVELKSREHKQKTKKNNVVRVSDSLDVKSESCKEKISTKAINVPENEGNPDSGDREENSSTKQTGGLLPSILQSPDHGVIDSTNNFIDFDESFRTPTRKTSRVYSSSVVDESKTEVSSSLDFVDSTADIFEEDCFEAKESEITSTRDRSEPCTTARDDMFNVTKDLSGTLHFDSSENKFDIERPDLQNGILQSHFFEKANDVSRSVITFGPLMYEKCGAELGNYKSTYSSNTEENDKCERLNIIQNYSPAVTSQRKQDAFEADSVITELAMYAACQPNVIQRANENKINLRILNDIESKQTELCLPEERLLAPDCQRFLNVKPVVNEQLNQISKEEMVGQTGKGEIGSKKFTLASGSIKKLINTAAKKVNFENVAKSYKIVKSNRLKTSELSRSPDGHSKDVADKSESRTPKFMKLDESDFIEKSLKVKEKVKFVSKSLDFRTSKTDGDLNKRGRNERGSTKTTEAKSVGSKTRTSQFVPIIFKKIEETKSQTSTERKRKSSQKGASNGKSSRSNQTTKRRHKSPSSNVIKTDINMKSTLKHINPSSIPQFAGDTSNDRKRKVAVVEPSAPKIKCVSNYASADAPESRTFEIKLVISDLGLKTADKFQGHGREPSAMPVICPSTVQFPPSHERVPYSSHVDQEGNFIQYPTVYQNEPALYCKKPEYPQKIQNGVVESSQTFFVSDIVEAPTAKFEPQRSNIIPFEQGYQDILPVLYCDDMKNSEMENGKLDVSYEDEITDLVERHERLNISDDRKYDNHGRTSSLEVGMAFSSVWNSGKFPSNTPRDLVISEMSDEPKDVDEELPAFVEPWEGPRDCCPDDDEFYLSALPDHQKLFSEEDLPNLVDLPFPPSNLNLDTVRPEDFGDFGDFGDMVAFDDKCLRDLRDLRDSEKLESTFNDNSFVLQEKFTDCDVPHIDEAHSDRYESCKKSARLSSSETRSDDQTKPCFEKGMVYDRSESPCIPGWRHSNRKPIYIPKGYSSLSRKLGRVCVCFNCSYKRRWIQYYAYVLRLRAVRMKELKRLHEADRLKSQDDELLRRIEESLKTKAVNVTKSYLSLPLKKRIKSLIENETYASESASTTFPSYPIKPMISIAEVQGSMAKEIVTSGEEMPHKAPSSKRKPDGSGRLVEVQVNSQQPVTPVIKTPKSPISSSETENSQPQTDIFTDSRKSQEKDNTKTKPKRGKMNGLRRRKTRKRKKEFDRVI